MGAAFAAAANRVVFGESRQFSAESAGPIADWLG
jgi:hypothetical protein